MFSTEVVSHADDAQMWLCYGGCWGRGSDEDACLQSCRHHFRDLSQLHHDVGVTVDEASTAFNVAQVSEPMYSAWRGLQRRAPAMALHGIMSQRMTSDLQVRRLAAVVGCSREVSSVPDDDGTVVDGVSTVFDITLVSGTRETPLSTIRCRHTLRCVMAQYAEIHARRNVMSDFSSSLLGLSTARQL